MNNKRKPLIGITTSLELNPNRLNDHKTIVSVDYSKAVINSGGIPFILPITENIEVIKEQIQLLMDFYFREEEILILLCMGKIACRKSEVLHQKEINLNL